MIQPHRPRKFAFALQRIAVWLSLVIIFALAMMQQPVRYSQAASQTQRQLTFEERVAYQHAIEAVYWRHRLWPQDNPEPKPSLDEVMPESAIRAKVEDYLRQSNALGQYWQQPITGEQLQAEIERMAQHTQQPEVLRELWAALSNDPFIIAECLARPLLVERLSRAQYEAEGQRQAEEKASFAEWWNGVKDGLAVEVAASQFAYRLPEIDATAVPCGGGWTATTSTTGAPSARSHHTAVWTGSEMIVWGGTDSNNISLNTGGRYNPATDSWAVTNTTTAPAPRGFHTAVWTGSEMIVWGNSGRTGGRYNPAADSWAATNTTGAPSGRGSNTAVWTGSEMIIWGGTLTNTGGRYNPTTDLWIDTNTTGSPSARYLHTAIWTGSEMIIWGGQADGSISFNTGGRYNPATDLWTVTNTTNAPSGRSSHTTVWTGSEMIVWGGLRNGIGSTNTGGRYNPATDSWAATSTTGAPDARYNHTAVWTSSEMIIWGGFSSFGATSTGRRYNPVADLWVATIGSAPSERSSHTAVWTGGEMIVWGGCCNLNTGGRYGIAPPLTISSTTQSFPATGGTGSINITAQGSCTWTARSNVTWITITSSSSGAGNGTVSYSVAPTNITTARTGTLTISDQTFTVTQAAGTPNPVPSLTTINPTTTTAGSAAFTLTVNGSNFINGSVVRWNGNDRVTTFVSSTQLTAAITAADVATPGTASVTVFNPAPAGGTSNGLTFAACGYNISPSSQSFSDDAGTGSVTVTGPEGNCGGWTATSNASWITITSGSSGSGNGTVNYSVTAYPDNTPRTGTLTIAGKTFTVTQIRQAVTVSAASYIGTALASEAMASAFGKKLATGTQVATTLPLPTTLGGTTIKVKDSSGTERDAPLFFVSLNQINYLIPSGTVNGAATVTVTTGDGVVSMGTVNIVAVAPGLFTANANGQGVPAALALRVRPDNPSPTVTSLSPTSASVGGAAFTLTVNGTNFVPGAVVRWNGSDRPTTYVNTTRLTAAISAADLASAGTAAVTVFNPEPGGGGSSAANLAINNPVPTISSLDHAFTTSSGPGFTLTVNGSNFMPTSVARWNGQDRATTYVSATRLTAEILASDLAAPGTGQVTVFNPAPGGGISSSRSIEIFDGSRDVRLTSGVVFNGSFSPSPVNACGLRVFPQYTIAVPFGATQLRIDLNATIEVNLYVRYNQRVDFPSTIIADYRSTAGFNNESVTVTSLPAGTYYIAVESCGTSAGTFTLRATVSSGFSVGEPIAVMSAGFAKSEPWSVIPARLTEPVSAMSGQVIDRSQPVAMKEPLARTVISQPAATLPKQNATVVAAPFMIAPSPTAQVTQTYESVARFDSAQNKFVPLPIDLGPDRGIATDQIYLILYGTGIRGRSSLATVTAMIGGLNAEVLYAGAQPDFVGLDQINVLVPRGLIGRGEVDLVLMVDGKAANTVRVNFK